MRLAEYTFKNDLLGYYIINLVYNITDIGLNNFYDENKQQ